jgi:hypothetical protein
VQGVLLPSPLLVESAPRLLAALLLPKSKYNAVSPTYNPHQVRKDTRLCNFSFFFLALFYVYDVLVIFFLLCRLGMRQRRADSMDAQSPGASAAAAGTAPGVMSAPAAPSVLNVAP